MASLHDRILYPIVFTDISTSTATGLATKILFSAIFFANKKADQTHGSRVLGSAFIVHFAQNILSSASGRKAMGRQVSSKACIQFEHCIADIQNVHHFKASSYFWHILDAGISWENFQSTWKETWYIGDGPFKEPRSHGAKMVSICLQPTESHVRASLCCYFLAPVAPEEQGTRKKYLEEQECLHSGEWAWRTAWPASHFAQV